MLLALAVAGLAALVAHGIFDFVYHLFIENPGVPHWWPGFCLAIDVVLGALLALRLLRRANALPDSQAFDRRVG